MKRILFVLGLFISLNASGQITYPSSVFWQFLEGYQAGDSSTQKYLEYKNGFLLLETNQRDAKILQARNELNDIGIYTIFIDANGNGGVGVDSSNGGTVVKLRGALSDHSYLNNTHVSIGRGGQTEDYGGNVDGAQFTVSDDREPGYGLWDADNYQMMIQSNKDSTGGYVGLAFTSENSTQDNNVGAFINYLKTGNNGKGELHFGTKTATGSLADGIHAMKIYDGSVTIDSTIVLPNLYTGTSDTSLVISNDTVYKRVLPSGGADKTVFSSNPSDQVAPSSTEQVSPVGSNSFNTFSRNFIVAPADGVISNFYLRTQGTQPADGDLVVTLQVGFVDTGMSITVPANTSSALFSDLVTTVSVSAGDIISFSGANAGTSNSARILTTSLTFTFD